MTMQGVNPGYQNFLFLQQCFLTFQREISLNRTVFDLLNAHAFKLNVCTILLLV